MQKSPYGNRGGRRGADAFVRQAQAQAMTKRHADLFKSAVLYNRDGAEARAEQICRLILSEDRNNVQAHHMLGLMAFKHRKLPQALDHLGRAVHVAPRVAELRVDYGAVLRADGQTEQAIAQLRRAIELKPGFAMAWGNLGNALAAQEEIEEAASAFRQALSLNPEMANVVNNLGQALVQLGRIEEGEAMFRRAIELRPDYALAHINLAMALRRQGRKQEARDSFDTGVAHAPEMLAQFQGLVFQDNYFDDDDPQQSLANALAYGDLLAKRAPVHDIHANTPDPDRRIRVGFVSGDFTNHPVGQFLEAVIANIDDTSIEAFAYMTSKSKDERTERFRQSFPHWHEVHDESEDGLDRIITEDAIDILVDLSGATAHNRLPLFARKPAPIQATWIGYSGTTGVRTIDYIIADRYVIPEGDDDKYAEAPWRLPDIYLCFTPPAQLPEVGPTPALANGFITFGCYNNPNKISEETILAWSRILKAVPDSRLILKALPFKSKKTIAQYRDKFAAHGISGPRLSILEPVDDRMAHFDSYNDIDIALDPFPYNGTTTTCDALVMGVPVLGVKGDKFVANVGESILRAVGMPDWLAQTRDEYVQKAVSFASDIQRLNDIRQGLRAQMLASPLCDAPRFARQLEDAFRQMWRIWCDKQKGNPRLSGSGAAERTDG